MEVLKLGLQLLGGAVARPLARRDPPRPQAGQHHHHRRRPGQDPRLRAGARFHGSDLSSTEGSVERRHVVGTPPYIPPEHLRGEPVDVRGDIYSLGVTLFEMRRAGAPSKRSNGMSLVTAILSAATPRPRALSPEVPLELDAIVHRAIARTPEERYGSAGDLESGPAPRELEHRRSGHALRSASRLSDTADGAKGRGLGGRRRGRRGGRAGHGNGRLDLGGRFTTGAPAAAAQAVVAVLPLSGAAGDPATEALAAGVADALITSLARVPGLTVISRSATLKYRDRGADVDVIARELGATLLVDGAIQRSGENLRLTVSVLQPGSKVIRWQNAYDGTFSEVFTLQREVASAVARRAAWRRAGPSGESRPPTASVEAYAEYSQARSFLERPDVKDNLDRGIALFQGAIAKDPAFARAHAGLGEAYWRKFDVTTGSRNGPTQARDEITEALRLDPRTRPFACRWRRSTVTGAPGPGRRRAAADHRRSAGLRRCPSPARPDPHRAWASTPKAWPRSARPSACVRSTGRITPPSARPTIGSGDTRRRCPPSAG